MDVEPAGAFREVIVIGQGPIGFSEIRTAPPYQFSMRIPRDTRPRRYNLTADGTLLPRQGAGSDPVTIDVERSDEPSSLKCEPSLLDFALVGDRTSLSPIGTFEGEESVDLQESSYIHYSSDNPAVAAVRDDGIVTATGMGSARIRISYRGRSVTVPVRVRQQPR